MGTTVKSKVLWGFRVQHAAWAQLALLVCSGGLPGLPATCTPQLQALDAKPEAECSSLAPASTAQRCPVGLCLPLAASIGRGIVLVVTLQHPAATVRASSPKLLHSLGRLLLDQLLELLLRVGLGGVNINAVMRQQLGHMLIEPMEQPHLSKRQPLLPQGGQQAVCADDASS